MTRPGVFDDEDPPEGTNQGGAWNHYFGTVDSFPVWDVRPGQRDVSPYDPAARRASWPAILAGQSSGAPAPTDHCHLHGGRCSGACERNS